MSAKIETGNNDVNLVVPDDTGEVGGEFKSRIVRESTNCCLFIGSPRVSKLIIFSEFVNVNPFSENTPGTLVSSHTKRAGLSAVT